jgi:hypothetical protein
MIFKCESLPRLRIEDKGVAVVHFVAGAHLVDHRRHLLHVPVGDVKHLRFISTNFYFSSKKFEVRGTGVQK